VNAVIQGRKSFETFACLVCHETTENDKSLRLGSNLYGLFQNTPRSREFLSSASGINPLSPLPPRFKCDFDPFPPKQIPSSPTIFLLRMRGPNFSFQKDNEIKIN